MTGHADPLPRSLLRAVRWMVDEQRMMLAASDTLADLGPFRSTVEMVGTITNPTPGLLEAVALLESQIRERERVQARAERVVSGI